MAAMFRRKAAPVAVGEAKKLAPAFGERTPEQMEAALKAARTARAEKKLILDRVRAGEISFEDLLGDAYKHDERIQRLPVASALRALPGMPYTRANKILDQAGIVKGRRVKGLGVRQRKHLIDLAK